MPDAQYTFDSEPNSYFNGADLRITETGTGRTILVNVKENMLAVNVKDDTIFRNYPADVQAAATELGEPAVEVVYQGVQRQFWDWAEEAAQRHGFEGVSQEGRSGGWLAVGGTGSYFFDEPDEGEDYTEPRDRFLALAFEAVESIDDGWRPQFFEDVKVAAELHKEAQAEAARIRAEGEPIIRIVFTEADVRGMVEDGELEGGVEIIGERWTLSNTDVSALLAALEYHGRSDTLGASCAQELHERLTGEPIPRERPPAIGECVAVCAACGAHVVVVPAAGIPPSLEHKPDCPREGWPVLDATEYDDGTQATRGNWRAA